MITALVLSGNASAQCPAVDVYEENDDCLNAVALTTGSYANLTVEGVASTLGLDFDSVVVPAGDIIQVDCLHIQALGDIDTYLYDAAGGTCGSHLLGDYLVRGYTSDDDETMAWINVTGAPVTVIIEIEPWANDTTFDCNDYSLSIATFPDPCALAR